MRTTHACTPSFRNFLNQYSRRLLSILAQPSKQNIIKVKNRGLRLASFFFTLCFVCNEFYFKELLDKSAQQKKNAEHTHMHTIFRNFLCQYSRRLLSILAPQKRHTNKTKQRDLCVCRVSLLFVCLSVINLQTCTVVQHKKKIRSTHACTPSFATFFHQYSRRLLSILAQIN